MMTTHDGCIALNRRALVSIALVRRAGAGDPNEHLPACREHLVGYRLSKPLLGQETKVQQPHFHGGLMPANVVGNSDQPRRKPLKQTRLVWHDEQKGSRQRETGRSDHIETMTPPDRSGLTSTYNGCHRFVIYRFFTASLRQTAVCRSRERALAIPTLVGMAPSPACVVARHVLPRRYRSRYCDLEKQKYRTGRGDKDRMAKRYDGDIERVSEETLSTLEIIAASADAQLREPHTTNPGVLAAVNAFNSREAIKTLYGIDSAQRRSLEQHATANDCDAHAS